MAARSRRRRISFASASLAALVALAVGFGGGWIARKETSATTSTSTTTTSSSTTSSTRAVTVAACTGADLAGSVLSSQGATGTFEATIVVTNTSVTTCSLDGYPDLQMLNTNGVPMTTTVIDGGASFSPPQANEAPRRYRLHSGGQATLDIQYSDIPTGTQSTCPQASSLNVYPPSSTTPFNVVYQLDPCGQGTINTSPFFVAT